MASLPWLTRLEIAELLGVAKQRAHQIAAEASRTRLLGTLAADCGIGETSWAKRWRKEMSDMSSDGVFPTDRHSRP